MAIAEASRTRGTASTLHLTCVAVILLSGCGLFKTGSPATLGTTEVSIPSDLQANVAEAEALGVSIYFQDKASAIATDALADEIGPLTGNPEGLGGWLTYRENDDAGNVLDAFLTEFITADEPPRVKFRIRVSMLPGIEPTVERIDPPSVIDGGRLILWRARKTAIDALDEFTQPLNSVILPGPEGTLLVYLLASTTKTAIAVFGKHHRFKVAQHDGTTILETMQLSKSALEVPLHLREGATRSLLGVTHLVTDYPLETHVFASLLYRLPIVVITERGVWNVERGKISYLGTREAVLGPD